MGWLMTDTSIPLFKSEPFWSIPQREIFAYRLTNIPKYFNNSSQSLFV